jgi:hypothetical protein
VTFIAGNGPIVVRTAKMTDAEWAAIVQRETERRS